VVLETLEAHERELERGDLTDLGGLQIGVALQQKPHIFTEGHRAP
jgi:hypothetical protein